MKNLILLPRAILKNSAKKTNKISFVLFVSLQIPSIKASRVSLKLKTSPRTFLRISRVDMHQHLLQPLLHRQPLIKHLNNGKRVSKKENNKTSSKLRNRQTKYIMKMLSVLAAKTLTLLSVKILSLSCNFMQLSVDIAKASLLFTTSSLNKWLMLAQSSKLPQSTANRNNNYAKSILFKAIQPWNFSITELL